MSQKIIDQANQLRDSGKTKEAMKILLPLTKSENYKIAVNAIISLGICYSNEGSYEKSTELYKKAILLCEKNKWLERIGSIYRDMAIAAKGAKKYKEAEKLFLKSIDFQKKNSDEGQGLNASLGITYSKLGLNYSETKMFLEARKAFKKAKRLLDKSDHKYWRLIEMIDESSFLARTSRDLSLRKAKKILEIAITEAIKQEKEYKLIEAFILAGDCERGLKNIDGAKMFYSMAELALNKIFDSKEVREGFEEDLRKRK